MINNKNKQKEFDMDKHLNTAHQSVGCKGLVSLVLGFKSPLIQITIL